MSTEFQIVTLIHNALPNAVGKFDPIHWEQDSSIAEMLQNGYKPEQISTTSGENGLITLTVLFSRHKHTTTATQPISNPEQATVDRFAEKANRGY